MKDISEVLYRVMAASMRAVRAGQEDRVISVSYKSDKTLLTEVDKASESAGLKLLFSELSVDFGVQTEERGTVRFGNFRVLFDPLDGTKPFSVGASTSTIILGVTDALTGFVTYCLVGEPASGRVWMCKTGNGTHLMRYDFAFNYYKHGETSKCVVLPPQENASGSTVFIDLYPGFTRQGRTIMSDVECRNLFQRLFCPCGVSMLGSNGLHHALVANGGRGIIGAITTAVGGPWDVCPVLLVLESGGFANAFRVSNDGNLIECNPLKVDSYDILITATSRSNLEFLISTLFAVKNQV